MSLPTRPEILRWIADNPELASRRDIARAFGLRGPERADLRRLMKDMEADGTLEPRRKPARAPGDLPPVALLRVAEQDAGGDLWLAPPEDAAEDAPNGAGLRILYVAKPGDPALGPGDRVLVRLAPTEAEEVDREARLIRRIGTGPRRILGIYRAGPAGGRIVPVEKGSDREWRVGRADAQDAQDGDLVQAEQTGPRARMGLPRARVTEVLGDPGGVRAVSLIAIHQHGIRDAWPAEVLEEAERAALPGPEGRADLRDLPLVTIDPADARDHDDAVHAHPDGAEDNPGGHVLWVAIADVAQFVRPGGALDAEARARGNSTYFPDRVVPMLPDRLSGDLCSLHEGAERPCIALRIRLRPDGAKIDHAFHRAIMRSPAALHYEEVQEAVDGTPSPRAEPLVGPVLRPLYAAYEALKAARARREPLDLDLPERRIELGEDGTVASVAFRDRLDAHRLIEECMILANVCAAETLGAARVPHLLRVHEAPAEDRIEALRETAEASGFKLPQGQALRTGMLNRLLAQAAGTDLSELISIATLRAMTQAYYAPTNLGHFGLSLRAYAHFTSPIRRYADLIVHRALATAHGWPGGLSEEDVERLERTAQEISDAERRSMAAERDTTDRYLAAFLADRVGAEFGGTVSGVQSFGLFVKLDGTGADGLIPVRSLGHEYFRYDRDAQELEGSESGTRFAVGARVTVRLAEADPMTGGLVLELLELDGQAPARRGRHKARRVVRRAPREGGPRRGRR
jgi:ribonuclease R